MRRRTELLQHVRHRPEHVGDVDRHVVSSLAAQGPDELVAAFIDRAQHEDAVRFRVRDPFGQRAEARRCGVVGEELSREAALARRSPERVGPRLPPVRIPLDQDRDPVEAELIGEDRLGHSLEVLARREPHEVADAGRVVDARLTPLIARGPPRVSWVPCSTG